MRSAMLLAARLKIGGGIRGSSPMGAWPKFRSSRSGVALLRVVVRHAHTTTAVNSGGSESSWRKWAWRLLWCHMRRYLYFRARWRCVPATLGSSSFLASFCYNADDPYDLSQRVPSILRHAKRLSLADEVCERNVSRGGDVADCEARSVQ
jgi:hypothetical protein